MSKRFFIFVLMGISILISLFSYANPLWAQESSETDSMLVANQLYERGNFAEALQTYQELVDSGIQESALFYNLGNAYFKQRDIGRALLNYERAARLDPRDDDIQANLKVAREQRNDQYSNVEASALSQMAIFTRSWLTLNEMALIALGLWLFFTLALLIYWNVSARRLRKPLQYTLLLTFFLLVMALLLLGNRLYIESVRPQAVVVVEEANVLSGPGEQYVTEFTLHSGAEVGLIETRGRWVRLTWQSDQLQGWVPINAVETVLVNGR